MITSIHSSLSSSTCSRLRASPWPRGGLSLFRSTVCSWGSSSWPPSAPQVSYHQSDPLGVSAPPGSSYSPLSSFPSCCSSTCHRIISFYFNTYAALNNMSRIPTCSISAPALFSSGELTTGELGFLTTTSVSVSENITIGPAIEHFIPLVTFVMSKLPIGTGP